MEDDLSGTGSIESRQSLVKSRAAMFEEKERLSSDSSLRASKPVLRTSGNNLSKASIRKNSIREQDNETSNQDRGPSTDSSKIRKQGCLERIFFCFRGKRTKISHSDVDREKRVSEVRSRKSSTRTEAPVKSIASAPSKSAEHSDLLNSSEKSYVPQEKKSRVHELAAKLNSGGMPLPMGARPLSVYKKKEFIGDTPTDSEKTLYSLPKKSEDVESNIESRESSKSRPEYEEMLMHRPTVDHRNRRPKSRTRTTASSRITKTSVIDDHSRLENEDNGKNISTEETKNDGILQEVSKLTEEPMNSEDEALKKSQTNTVHGETMVIPEKSSEEDVESLEAAVSKQAEATSNIMSENEKEVHFSEPRKGIDDDDTLNSSVLIVDSHKSHELPLEDGDTPVRNESNLDENEHRIADLKQEVQVNNANSTGRVETVENEIRSQAENMTNITESETVIDNVNPSDYVNATEHFDSVEIRKSVSESPANQAQLDAKNPSDTLGATSDGMTSTNSKINEQDELKHDLSMKNSDEIKFEEKIEITVPVSAEFQKAKIQESESAPASKDENLLSDEKETQLKLQVEDLAKVTDEV